MLKKKSTKWFNNFKSYAFRKYRFMMELHRSYLHHEKGWSDNDIYQWYRDYIGFDDDDLNVWFKKDAEVSKEIMQYYMGLNPNRTKDPNIDDDEFDAFQKTLDDY